MTLNENKLTLELLDGNTAELDVESITDIDIKYKKLFADKIRLVVIKTKACEYTTKVIDDEVIKKII